MLFAGIKGNCYFAYVAAYEHNQQYRLVARSKFAFQ